MPTMTNLPTIDRSLLIPVPNRSKLGGDARSRAFKASVGQLTEGARGSSLSGRQSSSQRRTCSANSLVIVCASRSRTASIPTRLIIPDLKLQFGERIQCAGESAELGSWDSSSAPVLAWTEGDNWVHHLQLPPGHHEFKLLIIRDDGTTHWEQGPNRAIEVPKRIDGIFEVKCQFEFTTSTETDTIPFPVKQQDERAIHKAEAEHSSSKAPRPKPGSPFYNDIHSQGDLPDAMEGDSTEREPDRLKDAKDTPRRFSWETDQKKEDKEREEALEGVSPPSSDPVKETEPPTDDKSVQGRSWGSQDWGSHSRNGHSSDSDGPELIVAPHKDSTWTCSGQAILANGSSQETLDLNRPDLTDITKRVYQARGRPVEMYGGAEAKELEDGTVLVKFPPDDKGEDILVLVERLLGDKIDLSSIL